LVGDALLAKPPISCFRNPNLIVFSASTLNIHLAIQCLFYLFLLVLLLLAGIILMVWLIVLHKIVYNRWSWCIGRYGTSLEGCSQAVNVSPVQIELIPSHRKIRPPESILPRPSQPMVSAIHLCALPGLQFIHKQSTKSKFKKPMAATWYSNHSAIYRDLHLRLAITNDPSLVIGITRIDGKVTLCN
jgi:hypothetical protein